MSNKVPGGLFVVSAPSGGGKTSVTRASVQALAKVGIPAEISVSYTTRAPRLTAHRTVSGYRHPSWQMAMPKVSGPVENTRRPVPGV